MTQKVLDYSYARFTPAQVHNLGAVAVCRYLTVVNPSTSGKLLTRAEAAGMSAAGIGLVSVFEFDSKDATKTLQDYVKAKLLPYKYPREIRFIAELPKTGTGKIDRQALMRM